MYQLILNEKKGKIRDLPELPPFPALGQQILKQVTAESIDIPNLAKTIEQDPAVFARIIGIANSAYFGCPDKIYTITHAIVRVLGLSMVKSLSLSIVLNTPFRSDSCRGFDMGEYWRKSLLAALVAQRLARYAKANRQEFQDKAYLAGILSHLGELVLAHLFPSEMSDVLRRSAREPEQNVAELQHEVIGVTSQEAAYILSRRWHLPKSLQRVYQNWHERDYADEDWELLNLIRLSQRLIEKSGEPDIMEQFDIRAMLKKLDLTEGQVNKLLQKMQDDRTNVDNLAAILVSD